MRKANARRAVVSILICAAAPVYAADLAVPKQYRTIEDALAAAQSGDRIVVRGGRHADVVVDKDGVTLVGHRAVLRGNVTISGTGDALRGFTIAPDSLVTVSGSGATIAGNRFGTRSPLVVEYADGVTVEGNTLAAAGVQITADDAVLRANRLPRSTGSAYVGGDRAVVESNVGGVLDVDGADSSVRSNRALIILAYGDDGLLADNSTVRGIETYGDRAEIRGNRAGGNGLTVFGDDAVVTNNVIRRAAGGVGIEGDRATIRDNDVRVENNAPHSTCWSSIAGGVAGIYVKGDGATVVGNVVVHRAGRGIVLVTAGAQVRENVLQGVAAGTSVSVTGKGNTLTDNHLSQTGSQIRQGDGFQVDGDANVLRDNDVSGTASDGVAIAGGAGNVIENITLDGSNGCGILVGAGATGTTISGATVSGGDVAFVNAGAQTSVVGSTFQNGLFADVVDVGGFRVFDGNTFVTLSHDSILVPQR